MSVNVKTVEKTFQKYGAQRVRRDKGGTYWRFPDNAEKYIRTNMSDASTYAVLGWVKDRYGYAHERPFEGHLTRGPKPVIDLTRCTASAHAQERLALMRQQQAVTFEEVLLALRVPSSVRYSDKHGSWIWVRDRIAVAAHVDHSGFATIATILWATADLWEIAPRPEKAGSR